MKTLICPMSPETIDKRVSRCGALLSTALLIAYAVTGIWAILAVVMLDYVIRVLTPLPAPLSLAGRGIFRLIGGEPKPMNKGPKIFAWRIGFLMSAVAVGLLFVNPMASVIVASVLAAFNFLDGAANFCLGCVIYTYVVLPFFGPTEA